MRDTILNPLPPYDWHSAETAQERDAINADVATILYRREIYSAGDQRTAEAPLEEIDPHQVFQTDCPASTRFGLLQLELTTRNRMEQFFDRQDADRLAAQDQTQKDYDAACRKVRKQLVAIGYVDQPVELGIQGTIIPMFLQIHPAIHQLNDRLFTLSGHESWRPVNAAEIKVIRTEMTTLRDAARRPR